MRSLLAWVVEAGVDGFRVDSLGTLTPASCSVQDGSRDMRTMLPEAWDWLARLSRSVRAMHPGALMVAEDMAGDPRVVTAGGFDADWASQGVGSLRTAALQSGVAGICGLGGSGGWRLSDYSRFPLRSLAQFATGSAGGLPPWARCIYSHNHDESPASRKGALVSLLWSAAGGAESEFDRSMTACGGGNSGSSVPRRLAAPVDGVLPLTLLSHAFIALGCPGLPMVGGGKEVLVKSGAEWPAPPSESLASRYPCPPPGSDAFSALVTYGAIARLRAGLPALAGGWVVVHHINDARRDRVIALARVAGGDPPRVGARGRLLQRWGAWETDRRDAVLVINWGLTAYTAGYHVGAPRAGLWAPVLDTGALVGDVLPRLLAAMGGAAADPRAEPGETASAAAALDMSRSELAAALARALVGISVAPGDPPIFAQALSAAEGIVAADQADFQSPPLPTGIAAAAVASAPPRPLLPTWLWGAPVNAPRGCYDAGPEGLPYSIAVPRLNPLTTRLYVRLSGCDALLPP